MIMQPMTKDCRRNRNARLPSDSAATSSSRIARSTRPQDRPAVVARSPDDQQGPDREGQDGQKVVRRNIADEGGVERAAEPHNHAADDERLKAEQECAITERLGRNLVLADRPKHPP